MREFLLYLIFTLCFVTEIYAQDSIVVFGYEEYIELVKEHHPVAFQANLKGQESDLYLQKAKGGFDPKLMGNAKKKYFDGKQYYSYLNGGLKVPTWFGVSLNAGYDLNNGERLSNESYTPDLGLWNAGITVNLGNGLFIDKRRADIKQSKFIQSTTLQEQRVIVNRLVYDATLAYVDWFKAQNQLLVFEEGVENAQLRLDNIRSSANFGDKPFIDTLKAQIQLQERELLLEQGLVNLKNKRELLNTYLWQDGFVPLELSDQLIPALLSYDSNIRLLLNIDEYINNHPDLIMASNDLEITNISYRLKKEQLKPTLELKYNALSSDMGNGVFRDYSVNNYNWGATISYPIFTRKERADVKLTGLKVEQNKSKIELKKAALKYKIQASYNQYLSLQKKQLLTMEQATQNYRDLLSAESELFGIGESSLFLVNVREQNLINASVKLIEMKAKLYAAKAEYAYQLMQN